MNRAHHLSSECSDSAKNDIKHQLEELCRHSGKESSDILPTYEKFVPVKNKKNKKNKNKVRERWNATVIDISTKGTT